jgi:molybdate transport system substrate-binding protein
MSATPSFPAGWSVGLRVWVERAGQALLGPGRADLLESIARWHSIREAARRMGLSYRRAWLLVQAANEAAGQPLVVATTGGSHGGGARLTPLGQSALAAFRALEGRLHQTADAFAADEPAGAGSVHVAAAVSLEEVLGQLLADYAARRPQARVRAVFGASDELAEHVLAGAPADLFLTADERPLDRLEAGHRLAPGARRALAGNSLVAIAAPGRALPVRRPADLARPGLAGVALASPGCPLGGYTRAYLEQEGLTEALLGRAVSADSSRAVVAVVRAGRADVGLVYGSDAVAAPDCPLLFRARLAAPVRYSAAVLAGSRAPEQARDLLDFLTGPDAAERFRRCGFLPLKKAAGP